MSSFWTKKFWSRGVLSIVFVVVLLLFQTAVVYGQTLTFNGVKFGLPLKQQDKKIVFKYPEKDGRLTLYLDVSGLADIGIHRYHIDAETIDGNVEKMSMQFSYTDSDRFVELLTEKYGKPVFNRSEAQTYGGAVLNVYTATWNQSGFQIYLISRSSSDLTKGYLRVSTRYYEFFSKEKREKEKKKQKGNL